MQAGVARRRRHEAHPPAAGRIQVHQVAQGAAAGARPGHGRVHVGDACKEHLARNVAQVRRHQRFDGDVVQRRVAPGLAREDHRLARDVEAREVVARIGFGVSPARLLRAAPQRPGCRTADPDRMRGGRCDRQIDTSDRIRPPVVVCVVVAVIARTVPVARGGRERGEEM